MEEDHVLLVKDSIQDQQITITTVVVITALPAVVLQVNAEVILPAFLPLVLYLPHPQMFIQEIQLLFQDTFKPMKGVLVKVQQAMFLIILGLAVELMGGVLLVSGLPVAALAVGLVVLVLPVPVTVTLAIGL